MGVAAAAAAAVVLVGALVVANRSDEDPAPADNAISTSQPITTDDGGGVLGAHRFTGCL
jgi:hypothetical protein